MNKPINDVLKANQAFYTAFASGDFASIEKLWSQSDTTSVIHPGMALIHGRKAVMASWKQILENSGSHSIRCANVRAHVHGQTAYVVCNEVFPKGRLIATNIFILEENEWRLVHHQAGPVPSSGRRKSIRPATVH